MMPMTESCRVISTFMLMIIDRFTVWIGGMDTKNPRQGATKAECADSAAPLV